MEEGKEQLRKELEARTPANDDDELAWQQNQIQVGSPDYNRVRSSFTKSAVTKNPSRVPTPPSPGKEKVNSKKDSTKKKRKKKEEAKFGEPVEQKKQDKDDKDDGDDDQPNRIELEDLLGELDQ